MNRKQDWPLRLVQFLKAAERRPFSWGETDCALLCADWVLEATGQDPAEVFRGEYSNQVEAFRALYRYSGSADLLKTASKMLGEPLANPMAAQRGDVCAIETPQGPALGICGGGFIAVISPTQGWGRHPLSSTIMSWRV